MPSKRCLRTLALSLRPYCGRIVLGAFREKAGLRQSVEECRRIGAVAMKHAPVLSGKAVADWRLSIEDYRLSAFGGRTLVGCVGAPRCSLGQRGEEGLLKCPLW